MYMYFGWMCILVGWLVGWGMCLLTNAFMHSTHYIYSCWGSMMIKMIACLVILSV